MKVNISSFKFFFIEFSYKKFGRSIGGLGYLQPKKAPPASKRDKNDMTTTDNLFFIEKNPLVS